MLLKIDARLVRGDGIGYFMHIRSVVVDHDLDFTNERAHYAQALELWTPQVDGRSPDKFAQVGMLLLWIPFYLLAHAMLLAAHAVGAPVSLDGYSTFHEVAVCVGSFVYGGIGLALSHRWARRVYGEAAAAWAVATFALASPLAFYLVVMPYMAHMNSFFAVAATLYLWLARMRQSRSPRWREFALLGALGGIMATVRSQDALFLLIPFGGVAARIAAAARRGDRDGLRRWLAGGALSAALVLAFFAAQLYTWHAMYGSLRNPQFQELGARTFQWTDPQLWGVLFSTRHGLFSWHPVLLVATVGLALHARRDRPFALSFLALLAAQAYLVASWWAWHQGDAFGGRVFLNAGFAWTLGLAAVFAWAFAAPGRARGAIIAACVLVAWNALALVQYTLGFVSRGAALTLREMTVERLLVPARILERWRGR